MATDKLVDFDHVTDYISREAEIRFFNDWVDDLDKQINDSVNYPHLRSDYKVCKTQLLDCIHAIKEMPTADVRPVVHGKWIRGNENRTSPVKDSYICSVCREKTLSGFCGNPAKTNFCPNCGADMREPNLDTTKGEGRDESIG